MGWASGSEIAQDIWNCVKKDLPIAKKKKLAKVLIEVFEANDCDTMYECTDILKAAGYKQCDECGSLFEPRKKSKRCSDCLDAEKYAEQDEINNQLDYDYYGDK